MNGDHPVLSGLRVLRRLSGRRGGGSFLAADAGRGRRPRWIVKELGASEPPRIREGLLDILSLSHPSLALAVSIRRDEPSGAKYLVRPYREGADLRLEAEARPLREVLPLLRAGAEPLGLLHRFGFLHRNLKPSNFIVARAPGAARSAPGRQVILCDPAWWPEEDRIDPGHPAAAPEVRRGERATFASDLYSLGAVFYTVLTGKRMLARGDGFPPPPRDLNRELPLDVERALMKLLNPDPSRRYQSVSALRDDLRSLGGPEEPALAPPDCFVGREAEISRAIAALKEPKRPAVLSVAGGAGAGKTAFLRRIALEAELLGLGISTVRCFSKSAHPVAPLRSFLDQLLPIGPAGRALRMRFRRLLGDRSPLDGEGESGSHARRMFVRGLIDLFSAAGALRPVLLLLDDVHQADPITVEFLADLARESAVGEGREGPRGLTFVVSFRTEGPYREAVRPLVAALSERRDLDAAIELASLPGEAVESWLHMALPGESEEVGRRIAAEMKGHPFLIRQAVHGGSQRLSAEGRKAGDLDDLYFDTLASSSKDEIVLLNALAVLGRPAARDLLASIAGRSASAVSPSLRELEGRGILSEEGGLYCFQRGSLGSWLLEKMDPARRQELHGKFAALLGRRGDASAEELAHHWLRSETPEKGLDAAIEAARLLARSHEDRRALVFYQAVLDHGPARGEAFRQAVALEAAEAYGRTGEYRRGIEILEGLLPPPAAGAEKRSGKRSEKNAEKVAEEKAERKASAMAGALHGRIGVFYHRAGEVPKALSHLDRGLALLEGTDRIEDRLRIESELAEITSNTGDLDRAESICRRALGEIAESGAKRKRPSVRRVEMVLLENLAHVRLRRFEYREARELYQESLRAGDGLGSVPEKSLILNNLGMLFIQENRFQQAIECYRRARDLSARLGDDLSLAAVHSNLAVLHAKVGDPEAAGEALARAALHDARCDSRRMRFSRHHSAGLVDLIFGRYSSAMDAFKAALALGEELQDIHTLPFDLVYLAECHLFRGEVKLAREALDRALRSSGSPPAPIPPMVEARRSLLAALRDDRRGALAALGAWNDRSRDEVPYLHAWSGLFAGWALRLLKEWTESEARLQSSRQFFSRSRVPAGEIHALLELAALETDRGRLSRAGRRLREVRERATCGRGALKSPMLSARLIAYEVRSILEGKDPDLQEAQSALVAAESYLIGRRLGDVETLLRDLRARLRRLSLEAPPAALARGGFATAGAVAAGEGVLEDLKALQGAASDLVRRFEEEAGKDRAEILRRHLADFEERLSSAQRSIEGTPSALSPAARAASILGKSPGIRRVVSLCLRGASMELPVVITGETGTGKELVARAIHGESGRRSAPFVSLSGAALPAELLEAELFGHVEGAFSGAVGARPGLLRAAQGGTFLFDEIGELPLPLQAKILRVLDSRRLRPLGSEEETEIDVRFLFTTHGNLRSLVEEEKFRRDLFFRLNGLEIDVPPLRERIEDLPELVDHFRAAAVQGMDEPPEFDASALRALASHSWPGNVRELANAVMRLVLTSQGTIGAEQVRSYLGSLPPDGLFSPALLRSRPLKGLIDALEREYILLVHAETGGDLEAVARKLGIRVRALYDRMKRLGIGKRDRGER